eukprot:1126473-Pleurochrysis_carterae.AAC.1
MGPPDDHSDQHCVRGRTNARSRRIRHNPNARNRHRCPKGIYNKTAIYADEARRVMKAYPRTSYLVMAVA